MKQFASFEKQQDSAGLLFLIEFLKIQISKKNQDGMQTVV